LAYPDNHIEADNRLSWLLGKLENAYGNDAFYVHLQRELISTAKSFLKRWDFGIMKSYRTQIVMGLDKKIPGIERLDVCLDYCETVNQNIKAFLKDKINKMDFHLESCESDFYKFWSLAGAEGSFEKAVAEWKRAYNASSRVDNQATADYR
jgi:hypothetical protein